MEKRKPNVLLIGEFVHDSSRLATRLDQQGCECTFASSCREAFLMLRDRKFDLVLSPTSLRDGTLSPMMGILEGSGTTVFYFCLVEDGCWWLPALRCGRNCFGLPAVRSMEFVTLLDETIWGIQSAISAARESEPMLVCRTDTSAMPVLRPRQEFKTVNCAGVGGKSW